MEHTARGVFIDIGYFSYLETGRMLRGLKRSIILILFKNYVNYTIFKISASGLYSYKTYSYKSLKKEIVKIKGAGVEPCPLAPLAGMITTTLPASRLVKPENCKTIKRYPYYFIRANRVG